MACQHTKPLCSSLITSIHCISNIVLTNKYNQLITRQFQTMVAKSVTSQSTSTHERQQRIASFKDRVATLKATSKVYNLHSDKSITTLDSSTIASKSVCSSVPSVHRQQQRVVNALPPRANDSVASSSNNDNDAFSSSNVSSSGSSSASVLSSGLATGTSGRLDFSKLEKRNPKETSSKAVGSCGGNGKKNPFDDDDDDSERTAPSEAPVSTTVPTASSADRIKNPFIDEQDTKCVAKAKYHPPNPFYDSDSDEDSDTSDSYVGEVKLGHDSVARNITSKQQLRKVSAAKSVSSCTTLESDAFESSCAASSIAASSVDGALFSGFQQVIQSNSHQPKKSIGSSEVNGRKFVRQVRQQVLEDESDDEDINIPEKEIDLLNNKKEEAVKVVIVAKKEEAATKAAAKNESTIKPILKYNSQNSSVAKQSCASSMSGFSIESVDSDPPAVAPPVKAVPTSSSRALPKAFPAPSQPLRKATSAESESSELSSIVTPVQPKKSLNPFADILAMRARERQTNKKAAEKLMNQRSVGGSVGTMNMESSCPEAESIASSSAMICVEKKGVKFTFDNVQKVKSNPFDDDSEFESKEVAKQANEKQWYNESQVGNDDDSSDDDVSSAQSNSLDGVLFSDLNQALSKIQSVSYEETAEEEEHESTDRSEKVSHKRAALVVPSGESCAVSSLKDTVAFETDNRNAMLDVDGSFENEDEVASVPKSPAPLEKAQTQEGSVEGNNEDDNESFDVEEVNKTIAKALDIAADSLASVKSPDEKVRKSLKPPKKDVVLRDGSISTKDSILGKTIRITNADIVAERIYLESLRAQVHAELMVHVADEEIRLALSARLQAIRDFYKRKATVSHLRTSHDDDFLEKVVALPQVEYPTPSNKPKILREEPSVEDHIPMEQTAVSSVTYAKGATMNSSTRETHQFAFERAQANINRAIKAAHISLQHSEEEAKVETIEEEQTGEFFKRMSTDTPIPIHIFTQDTYWDNEEGVIPYHPDPKSLGQKYSNATKNAWSFYSEINSLIFESRVYDYEFQIIQEDPLYAYLNSLVGIADSGDGDGDKQIKQTLKMEYKDMSPHRICHSLAKEASQALPALKAICSDIGNRLGMQTMAVGKKRRMILVYFIRILV